MGQESSRQGVGLPAQPELVLSALPPTWAFLLPGLAKAAGFRQAAQPLSRKVQAPSPVSPTPFLLCLPILPSCSPPGTTSVPGSLLGCIPLVSSARDLSRGGGEKEAQPLESSGCGKGPVKPEGAGVHLHRPSKLHGAHGAHLVTPTAGKSSGGGGTGSEREIHSTRPLWVAYQDDLGVGR